MYQDSSQKNLRKFLIGPTGFLYTFLECKTHVRIIFISIYRVSLLQEPAQRFRIKFKRVTRLTDTYSYSCVGFSGPWLHVACVTICVFLSLLLCTYFVACLVNAVVYSCIPNRMSKNNIFELASPLYSVLIPGRFVASPGVVYFCEFDVRP